MEIDIIYDKNIIYYNDNADCIVAAWLLKQYIKSTTGNTPITFKMDQGDKFRLENVDDKTTIWVIGLHITYDAMEFLNRYSSKVKWFYNNVNDNKNLLLNYDIYDNIDYYTNFIHNKYNGNKNIFIDNFLTDYDYYDLLIYDISQVEELYNRKVAFKSERKWFNKIKKRLITNIIKNSYKKEYDNYNYYLIYDSCCIEDVVEYILSIEDAVIVTYNIEKVNMIKYKVNSNIFKLEDLSKNVGGSMFKKTVVGKTNTVNTLFLDIPNML